MLPKQESLRHGLSDTTVVALQDKICLITWNSTVRRDWTKQTRDMHDLRKMLSGFGTLPKGCQRSCQHIPECNIAKPEYWIDGMMVQGYLRSVGLSTEGILDADTSVLP